MKQARDKPAAGARSDPTLQQPSTSRERPQTRPTRVANSTSHWHPAEPKNARAALGVASIGSRIAGIQAEMGGRRGSESAFVRAVAHAEQNGTHFPEQQDAASLVAAVNRTFGETYQQKWSSYGKARPLLLRALDLYRTIKDAEGTERLINAWGSRTAFRPSSLHARLSRVLLSLASTDRGCSGVSRSLRGKRDRPARPGADDGQPGRDPSGGHEHEPENRTCRRHCLTNFCTWPLS